jgi:hypothetical protein
LGLVFPASTVATDANLYVQVGNGYEGKRVALYVDGEEETTGLVTNGYAKFQRLNLPKRRYVVQFMIDDDVISELSDPITLSFVEEENIVPVVPPPTISPSGVSFSYPVTVTITSNVPSAEILYTTNGTGWAAPSTRYTGPFTVCQTTVIKAKAVYRHLKGFLPVESKVVKTTIRIVR